MYVGGMSEHLTCPLPNSRLVVGNLVGFAILRPPTQMENALERLRVPDGPHAASGGVEAAAAAAAAADALGDFAGEKVDYGALPSWNLVVLCTVGGILFFELICHQVIAFACVLYPGTRRGGEK